MNSFNDTVVPFLWIALLLLSWLTPIVAIIGWITIIKLDRILGSLLLTLISLFISIAGFYIGYDAPILICVFLFFVIVNRSLVRQGYSKTHKRFVSVVNILITGILLTMLLLSYLQQSEIWQWDMHNHSTYIITALNVYLGIVLMTIMYLYPLKIEDKAKGSYRRDRTLDFILIAVILGILTGLYISYNRYSFMCTSLGVMFPSLILHRLNSTVITYSSTNARSCASNASSVKSSYVRKTSSGSDVNIKQAGTLSSCKSS